MVLSNNLKPEFLLICLLLIHQTHNRIKCPEGSVVTINDSNEEECHSCGENCLTCLLMEKKEPNCFYCKEGFYLNKTKKKTSCKPCFSGCRHCIGPNLSQCSETMPNFFYNTKSLKIEQCQTGCERCFSPTECSICSDFFYSKSDPSHPKEESKEDILDSMDNDETAKKKLDMGKVLEKFSDHPPSLNCVACNIPNCRFCKEVPDKIKKTSFISCSLCEKGYGIVDGKCGSCPENCEYCHPQTLVCLHCTAGFQWNKKKAVCEKITAPNCSFMKKGECKSCDNLFYLDIESKTCKPCRESFPNCQHCMQRSNGEGFRCRFCERGYYVVNDDDEDGIDDLDDLENKSEDTDKSDEKKGDKPDEKKGDKPDEKTKDKPVEKSKKKSGPKPGTCAKCPENCSHCGGGDGNRCYICKENYFYSEKSKKCLKCKIKNCESCLSTKTCSNCLPGYRFNKKTHKCKKCAGNCLRCSDKGHCYECPVDHFVMLHEKIKRKKGQNILNNLLGMFLGSVGMNLPSMPVTTIEFRTECLKKCPEKIDDHEVIVNYSQRRCVVKTTEQTQQIPGVSLPSLSKTGSFYLEVQKLKLTYLEEIHKIKMSSMNKTPDPKIKVSEECFKNGLIRKIYRGNLSSFYICRCLPGFLGDNCQITEELHQTIQQKLLVLLDNIHKRLPSMPKQRYKEVLNTLIEFNKFKIDETVVSKLMEALGFFLDRNYSIENKKRLYVLYDSILLSIFNLLEDIHKSSNNQLIINFDAEQEEIILREKVKKVVMLIEASFEDLDYAHSFLNESLKEYVGLQTYSFIVSEFRLTETTFQTANPNIDSSFNTEDVTQLDLVSLEEDHPPNPKFNIQLLNFSVELFQPEFSEYDILTNVLYVKFLDSLNPHIRVINKSIGISGIILSVPLLTLPTFVDIKDHIYCMGFKSGGYKLGKIQGVVQNFDEDSKYVKCLFEDLDAFTNTYYAVFIKKRDDKD